VRHAIVRRVLTTCAFVVLAADHAAAQQRPSRFTVWFGAGVQAAMPPLTDRFDFFMHGEDAPIEADYDTKAALLVDGGFAVRVAKSIGVGVSVSRFKGDGSAAVNAQIPNPFEFNKFREVSGTASGLDNTELGYHVQLQFARPLTHRLRLVVSAGPTWFDVKRQLVTSVQVDESFPFDTAAFRSAPAAAAKGSGIGFNAGADIAWTFNRSAGVGAIVRYARGQVDVNVAARSVTVDVGGLQTTAGLRLSF
jgi:hypothetical protein